MSVTRILSTAFVQLTDDYFINEMTAEQDTLDLYSAHP